MIVAEPVSAPAPDWSKKLRTTAGDKAELAFVLNCPYDHGQRVVKVTHADGTQDVWRCRDDGCPVGIARSEDLRVINYTKHHCENKNGDVCEENAEDSGKLLLTFCEDGSWASLYVDFCPFCGAAAKVKA